MHEFYKRALIRFTALFVFSILAGLFCVDRSFVHARLMPAGDSDLPWVIDTGTDAPNGGKSTIRILDARQALRFAMHVSSAYQYPRAEADLYFLDAAGRRAHIDLSRFDSISFYVECGQPNTLMFSVPTFDPKVSKRDDYLTYRSPSAFFSCNQSRSLVELDLTRLETPQWWFQMFKLDLAGQAYQLDQVPRLSFGNTFQSPADIDSTVEISGLAFRGRDYRYLGLLGILLVTSWSGFAIWFFRRHTRALTEDVKARLQKDLPFVAYQQLSLEPHRDKEKAAVLGTIGAQYADPELDLDKVVEATGVNRNKINDILKAELGYTFSGYLNKLRLTEAARLLSEKSSATVAEIAYSVGYGNVSYFNKLFKEEYGCTPKAFRSACDTTPPG